MPEDATRLASEKPPTRSIGWQPPSTEELQQLLPQYEITTLLGRGGMGAVYKGTQKNLERAVAIKILPPGMDDEDSGANFTERFKNEARAMAKLNHPGIVEVYDFGETANGVLYIVMEFIEGTDVQKMVSEQKRLHSEHAMAITAHVCDALQYAHDRNIIHRDIKPANIMVGYNGVVKVADFGLAKMDRAGESGLTRSGMAMGTLHYMAPEALMLGSSVDHRADIYAVGVMLYYMLTGRLPQGMFELPSLQVPGLDPRYDGIITKALRDDRELRYQTTAELRLDLDGILTQPVVKVSAGTHQAPPALETQARPQRPPGQPYRPPQQAVIVRTEKKSSPLLWVAIVVMGGLALWLWLDRQSASISSPATAEPAKNEPSAIKTAPAEWRSLLEDKPELIERLKITDSTTPDWKLMQRGFAPVLDAKNVALRLKARSYKTLRLVARWSETAHEGIFGHTIRIGPGTSGSLQMFCGWINQTTKVDGVLQPGTYKSTQQNPPFEIPEGQEYELELRSLENHLVVLVDGKVRLDRVIALPGHVMALHPFGPLEFKELEWRQLPPESVASGTQAQMPPASQKPPLPSPTASKLKPGIWHDLIKENLISTAGLIREAANDGSGRTLYRAASLFVLQSTPVFRDCVVRVKFGVCQWKIAPWLRMRQNARMDYVSSTCVDNDAVLRHHHPPISAWNTFGKKDMGSALLGSQPFVLELKAVGDQYTFSKDGEILVEGKYSGCDQGTVGVRLDPGTVIESFEVMPLTAGTTPPPVSPPSATTTSTASTPAPADTRAMELLLDADFAKSSTGFSSMTTPNIDAAWKDGHYQMKALSSAVWVPGQSAIQRLDLQDLVCEIEFRVPQDAKGSWGLGLGNKTIQEGDRWQALRFEASGRAMIPSPSQAASNWFKTPATPAGGDWNKVRFEALNSRYRLFVNDQFVTEVPQEGRTPPSAMSLFLNTPQPGFEVWFRRVRIWQPKSDSTVQTASNSGKADPTSMPLPATLPTNAVMTLPTGPVTWTDAKGRRITATFKTLASGNVLLEIAGKVTPVPLNTLSAESQKLARDYQQQAPPATASTTAATFTNSLGMKFVPVPGTPVLFCIHETRYGDFAAFAAEVRLITNSWKNQTYGGIEISTRNEEHPVIYVTPKQAVQFCAWLSLKEGKKYRLPTQEEWSLAASGGIKAEFPWGAAWPPPANAGNYSDESYHKLRPTDPFLAGYDDGFATTAPVMSFKPNTIGIYDLGGNVWEMTHTGDPAAAAFTDAPPMVDRGASFLHDAQKTLRSANEQTSGSSTATPDKGFRIVLETTP